jgi:hypothetical protein
MIAGTRGFCDSNLAVGVKEFVTTSRAHEDRRIILGAEKLHTGIDLRDIIETAGEELEFQAFGLLISSPSAGAQIIGSGSLDGPSVPLADMAPDANSGLPARYCRKRRRLQARTISEVIQFLRQLFF